MIIGFADEENSYGRIETEEDIKKIEKLLNEYRKINDEYNIDDFYEYLKEKNIKFTILQEEVDRTIHF